MMSKKKEKEIEEAKRILSNAEGDWPCICGHMRRSHLGANDSTSVGCCFGCYQERPERRGWCHSFQMDNLTYIEKLHNQKELNKFKKLEKYNEPRKR